MYRRACLGTHNEWHGHVVNSPLPPLISHSPSIPRSIPTSLPLTTRTWNSVVSFLVSSCSSERSFCKVQTGEWMSPDELTPGLVLSTAGVKLHALAMAGRLPMAHQPALLSPLSPAALSLPLAPAERGLSRLAAIGGISLCPPPVPSSLHWHRLSLVLKHAGAPALSRLCLFLQAREKAPRGCHRAWLRTLLESLVTLYSACLCCGPALRPHPTPHSHRSCLCFQFVREVSFSPAHQDPFPITVLGQCLLHCSYFWAS